MGGTFDPIHYAHLLCAEEARVQFDLDEVLFLPAGDPWQKGEVTSAEDRYMMVVLAISSNPHFSASRIEIDRPGPTYTLDTLHQIREFVGPEAELFFIAGADALAEMLTWKEPEALFEQATFVAAGRPDVSSADAMDPGLSDKIQRMDMPQVAISSTDIRRRVSEGRSIRYMVPSAIADYISERGLYRPEGR